MTADRGEISINLSSRYIHTCVRRVLMRGVPECMYSTRRRTAGAGVPAPSSGDRTYPAVPSVSGGTAEPGSAGPPRAKGPAPSPRGQRTCPDSRLGASGTARERDSDTLRNYIRQSEARGKTDRIGCDRRREAILLLATRPPMSTGTSCESSKNTRSCILRTDMRDELKSYATHPAVLHHRGATCACSSQQRG